MKKFDFVNKKHIKNIKEYIVCLIIIEVLVILMSMFGFVIKKSNSTILTEISKVNATQIDNEIINNYKIEVLDYNELSYYIKVNCKTQVVVIYTLDEDGQYTIPIRTMICSTGKSTPTEGVFEISDKYEWRYLVGDVYGQYATRITGSILFHSVPYTKKDKSTLEYWEFEKLGQPVSKGCVRLTVEDAKWIYDYCKSGTKVEFCEDDERENAIKKELQISDYDEKLRGWDPTDPDPNNPWLEYKEQNKGEKK